MARKINPEFIEEVELLFKQHFKPLEASEILKERGRPISLSYINAMYSMFVANNIEKFDRSKLNDSCRA